MSLKTIPRFNTFRLPLLLTVTLSGSQLYAQEGHNKTSLLFTSSQELYLGCAEDNCSIQPLANLQTTREPDTNSHHLAPLNGGNYAFRLNLENSQLIQLGSSTESITVETTHQKQDDVLIFSPKFVETGSPANPKRNCIEPGQTFWLKKEKVHQLSVCPGHPETPVIMFIPVSKIGAPHEEQELRQSSDYMDDYPSENWPKGSMGTGFGFEGISYAFNRMDVEEQIKEAMKNLQTDLGNRNKLLATSLSTKLTYPLPLSEQPQTFDVFVLYNIIDTTLEMSAKDKELMILIAQELTYDQITQLTNHITGAQLSTETFLSLYTRKRGTELSLSLLPLYALLSHTRSDLESQVRGWAAANKNSNLIASLDTLKQEQERRLTGVNALSLSSTDNYSPGETSHRHSIKIVIVEALVEANINIEILASMIDDDAKRAASNIKSNLHGDTVSLTLKFIDFMEQHLYKAGNILQALRSPLIGANAVAAELERKLQQYVQ